MQALLSMVWESLQIIAVSRGTSRSYRRALVPVLMAVETRAAVDGENRFWNHSAVVAASRFIESEPDQAGRYG